MGPGHKGGISLVSIVYKTALRPHRGDINRHQGRFWTPALHLHTALTQLRMFGVILAPQPGNTKQPRSPVHPSIVAREPNLISRPQHPIPIAPP